MERVCTPFCDAACPGEHHPLLQALVKCPEKEVGVEQSPELQTLAHTVRHCVENGWKKSEEIPEKDVRFRFPTLHWAAVLGRLSAVSFLVNDGFDPKLQTSEGHTALHRVCLRMFECFQHQGIAHRAKTKLKRLVELLIVSLSVKDNERLTPLLLACESYMMSQGIVMNEFYAALISSIGQLSKNLPHHIKDIVLNSNNSSGNTALHILAVSDMFAPCLSTLLLSGANPSIQNALNLFPFQIANQSGATRNSKQLRSAILTRERELHDSSEESSLCDSHSNDMLDEKGGLHTVVLKQSSGFKPTRTVLAPIASVDAPASQSRTVPKLVIKSKEGVLVTQELTPSSNSSLSSDIFNNHSSLAVTSTVATSHVKKVQQQQQHKVSANPPPLMTYMPTGIASVSSGVVEDNLTYTGATRRDVERLKEMPELMKPVVNVHENNTIASLPSTAVLTELIASRNGERLTSSIDEPAMNRKHIDRNRMPSGGFALPGSSSVVKYPPLQPADKQSHGVHEKHQVQHTENDVLRHIVRFSPGNESESRPIQTSNKSLAHGVSHKRKHADADGFEPADKSRRFNGTSNDLDVTQPEMVQSHLHSLEKYVASQAEEMNMSMRLLEARKTVNTTSRELVPPVVSTQYETVNTISSTPKVVSLSTSFESSTHSLSESERPTKVANQSDWLPVTTPTHTTIDSTTSNGLDVSLSWVPHKHSDVDNESEACVVAARLEIEPFVMRVREMMMTSVDTRDVVHMLADAEIDRYKRRMEEAQREYQVTDDEVNDFEVRHGIKLSLVRSLTKQVDTLGSQIERFSDQHDDCLYKSPRLEDKLSKVKEDFAECKRVMRAHDRLQTNFPHLKKSAARKRERLNRVPSQLVAQVDKATITSQYPVINSRRHIRRLMADSGMAGGLCSGTAGGSPIHQASYG